MADGQSVRYQRILLPTDGSPQSVAAAQHALYLARSLGAALTALYVIEIDIRLGVHIGEEVAEVTQTGEQALAEVESLAAATDLSVTTLLREGKITDVILDEAKELNADLIVMGAHSMGALERMLLGSVSTVVAQHASCPVLLVR